MRCRIAAFLPMLCCVFSLRPGLCADALEEEVLGVKADPRYVEVGVPGAVRCSENTLMLAMDLWRHLPKDSRSSTTQETARVLDERFRKERARFRCPAGGQYRLVVDSHGRARVACDGHEKLLPPPGDDRPETVRFPHFDLSGRIWNRETEVASEMKISVHVVNVNAEPAGGESLADRMLKAVAPDKYLLKKADAALASGDFFQALAHAGDAVHHARPAAETSLKAATYYKKILSTATRKQLPIDRYHVVTMRAFDYDGTWLTPSQAPRKTAELVAELDSRRARFSESPEYRESRRRLEHFLTYSILADPLSVGFACSSDNGKGSPYAGVWVFRLRGESPDTDGSLLWFLGPKVNRVVRLVFERGMRPPVSWFVGSRPVRAEKSVLDDVKLGNRGTLSIAAGDPKCLFLGWLASEADRTALMKSLAFPDKGELKRGDPETEATMDALGFRIYRIPLSVLLP